MYYLIRSDHPSNKKRGSICIYYENFLPLKVSDIRFLDERITFDLKVGNKLAICMQFVALDRSASHSQDNFAIFSDYFETTLNGTLATVHI